jgi:hypothetical protein
MQPIATSPSASNVSTSWFPDIHVHINAALRATREQISCEQSRLDEGRPA